MKQHLLFVGIVGHAMRGLALAAKHQGHQVTGLDEAADDSGSQWLAKHNIPWTREPDPKLLVGVDLVIISGGTPADYPLLAVAQKLNIPIQSFAQFLGAVTAKERALVVAGTHGKTTTTSFIAWILDSAGRHPDFLIGIKPFNFDSSARLDDSDVVVIEGDEYKASNLDTRAKLKFYHPDVLVLTSVEHDHPDVYPDLQSVVDCFTDVVKHLPKDGRMVACAESQVVLDIAKSAPCPVVTYGLEIGDYTARDIAYLPTGIEFDVFHDGQVLGRIAAPLYGKHNILNALAAVAVCLSEGLTIDQIIAGAAGFKGAYRRFNLITSPSAPITVIDDYGHHPTEATTNIEAAKLHFPGRRVVVIYKPHTYTRTEALLPEYLRAFDAADLVYIGSIDAAREAGLGHTVTGNDIVQGLEVPALYVPERDDLLERIRRDAKPGDVILCFSVSGYQNLAQDLAKALT
jgi:UDP-N-acetylmuramate--alanine ligase